MCIKEVIQAVLRRTDLKRMEQAAQRLGGGRGRRVPPLVGSVAFPLPLLPIEFSGSGSSLTFST